MKKLLALILAAVMVCSIGTVAFAAESDVQHSFSQGYVVDIDLTGTAASEPKAWGAVPNDAQRYYQQQGLAAFCHFGPNTFQNVEWGSSYGDTAPSTLFTLNKNFDADRIVKMLKDAGFSRLILTCKHHDGFAIWDCSDIYEEYDLTPYTIAQTKYKDGKGDILEELSDACTKYNMDMGIYLSPWDIHLDNKGIFGSTKRDVDGQEVEVEKNKNGGYLTYQNKYNDFYVKQIESIINAVKTDEKGNKLYNEDGTPKYKYGNNSPDRREGSDRFVEWWMDGATGRDGALVPQYYDWDRIIKAIRKDNPNCQIFGTNKAGENDNTDEKKFDSLSNTGGIHWIGNEEGYANSTTWSKLDAGSPGYENTSGYPRGEHNAIIGRAEGKIWSVPECDTKMLSSGWFWSSSKQSSLRSMSNLADIYFGSVGNGGVLLLNSSPNTDGTLDENQFNRFKEFGDAIKNTFKTDFTKGKNVAAAATSVYGNDKKYSASNVIDTIPEGEQYDDTYWAPESWTSGSTQSLEIDFGNMVSFDVVSLEEYIPLGQKISQFSVEYRSVAGTWKKFGSGTTIGAKKLLRGPEVTATAVRVNIEGSYELPMINNVGVYKAVEAFESGEQAEDDSIFATDIENYDYVPHTKAVKEGNWASSKDNAHAWSDTEGAKQTYTVTGSQIAVKVLPDPNASGMEIKIDSNEPVVVNTQGTRNESGDIIYVSDELTYGQHTVTLTTKKVAGNVANQTYNDIFGIYVLDNDGVGIVSIEKEEYRTCSENTQVVKVVRRFGSKGTATVAYGTVTGSAEQNVGYKEQYGTIVFAEGETEKLITLETLYNEERGNDNALYFYIALYPAEEGEAILGNNVNPKVYIEPVDLDTENSDIRDYMRELQIYEEDAYDAESYELFQQRLQEAKDVVADLNSTNIQRGSALRALELAYESMGGASAGGGLVDQSTLTATAENYHVGNGAELSINGNNSDQWHTVWAKDTNGSMPDLNGNVGNSLYITLPEEKNVIKVTYLPRQDDNVNGIITKYEMFVSTSTAADPKTIAEDDWKLVSSGDWAGDHDLKEAAFTATAAKHIKLRAKATLNDGTGTFISAAEINVYAATLEPVEQEVDRTDFERKLDTAKKALEKEENQEKKDLLTKAIADAQALAEDASQADIDAVIDALEAAILHGSSAVDPDPGPGPNPSGNKTGDVDGSGDIGTSDVTLVLQYIAGIVHEGDEGYDHSVSDVTGDEVTDTQDVTAILQYIATIITKFPAEG